MKKIEFKTTSAEQFKCEDGIYRFPFKVLDDTPGGNNLGRIEWHLEALHGKKKRGRYYFEKLHVWATQTRDPRYQGVVFEIPCFTEAILGDPLKRESYLNYVWRMMPCEIHKVCTFSAYPANNHSVLEVNVGSSIGIDLDFK